MTAITDDEVQAIYDELARRDASMTPARASLVSMANTPSSTPAPKGNPPTPIKTTGDPKAYPTVTKGGVK